MSAPVIPQSGAATVNRKWLTEIDLNDGVGSANWAVVEAVQNSQFQPDQANMVGDTDQGGKGFQASTKTGATWSVALTVGRKVTQADPTVYGPVQEHLRLKAIGKFGPSNSVVLRVSEYDPNDPTGALTPRLEAYTGRATVAWDPQGGDMLAEDLVNVSLQGQGALTIISHPYPRTAALIPVIAACTPGSVGTIAAAGGVLVHITGTGFLGVTGPTHVTIAGSNAVPYSVENDNLIIATAPAHAAGAVNLVVTNATGASAPLSVTYA